MVSRTCVPYTCKMKEMDDHSFVQSKVCFAAEPFCNTIRNGGEMLMKNIHKTDLVIMLCLVLAIIFLIDYKKPTTMDYIIIVLSVLWIGMTINKWRKS